MKVIFRQFKKSDELIAIFPEQNWKSGDCSRYGTVMSYMHIGQHSEADYTYLLKVTTPPKSSKDLIDLIKEIETVYNEKVEIYKRWR